MLLVPVEHLAHSALVERSHGGHAISSITGDQPLFWGVMAVSTETCPKAVGSFGKLVPFEYVEVEKLYAHY